MEYVENPETGAFAGYVATTSWAANGRVVCNAVNDQRQVAAGERSKSLLGKEVARIEEGRLEARTHYRLFKAGNLPGGVYYYRLEAEGGAITRKMILMR